MSERPTARDLVGILAPTEEEQARIPDRGRGPGVTSWPGGYRCPLCHNRDFYPDEAAVLRWESVLAVLEAIVHMDDFGSWDGGDDHRREMRRLTTLARGLIAARKEQP